MDSVRERSIENRTPAGDSERSGQRLAAGDSERGSVSLELIGSLPVILVSVLVAAQIVIAGAALWSAGVAARAGARAVLTGKAPEGAAERALPGVLRGGLKVSQKDGVRVGVRVPGLLPGFPETHVYGSSSLGDG